MSYDLVVFDPTVAPLDRDEFLSWYRTAADETQGLDCDVPFSAPGLRSWLQDIVQQFPSIDGPLASSDVDNPRWGEYGLSTSMIYASFTWSQAAHANQLVRRLAVEHGIGFFDASGTAGAIWRPGAPPL